MILHRTMRLFVSFVILGQAPIFSPYCWAISSSANYQADYASLDGGGGVAGSTSYFMNASAIGKSLNTGMSMSTLYSVEAGTPLLDDDGDGLDNGVEQIVFNTDPSDSDTDNDLLGDGEEVITVLTDPTLFDTDGDTLGDGEEVASGWNPLDALDPFGIIENVPFPVWAILALALTILTIQKRAKAR